MIALLNTAERTSNITHVNNYIFQRHVFAYKQAIKNIGNLVIELGCGSGYGISLLAPYCSWYAGVDKKAPPPASLNSNSAFFKSHLPRLNNIGDNSFDTVVCFQVIEHIKEDTILLNEVHRILKPGGKLLLTTPNKLMSLTRNPYHVREYCPVTMEEKIARSFGNYQVMGIYGNTSVMEYYAANKRNTEKIKALDIFNLQFNLPSALLKIPYNLANNINRLLLYRQNENRCTGITWQDYFIGEVTPQCLDFFVVAEKKQIA